jgi:predicted branched-subunit amino acid permease
MARGRNVITEPANIEDDVAIWVLFKQGFKDGFSLPAFMVASSMLGYGALVHSSGMSIYIAVVSTMGIWGLPGQVAFIEYVLLGAPLMSMILAVSLANMRFLPMSLTLVPLFRGSPTGWRWRYLWVQLMSINTWVGLIRKSPELTPDQRAPYFAGFSTICMLAGAGGTGIGFLLAETLPFFVTVTLIFINPIYFAFIFAGMRVRACLIAFITGAVAGPLIYLLTPEWSLPISGLIAGTIGFYADRMLRRMA